MNRRRARWRSARKGMSLPMALIILVLFGAIFLVLALIYKQLFSATTRAFSDQECQASLLLTRAIDAPRRAASVCVLPIENPVPLKCSRHFLSVSDTTVTDTGGEKPVDRTREFQLLEALNNDGTPVPGSLAKRVLAQEMRRCWAVFNEGQMVVFQQVDKAIDLGANEHACFVCAEVNVQTPVTGFKEYLKGTTMPPSAKNAKETRSYYDFLAGNPASICNPVREKTEAGACWDSFSIPYKAPVSKTEAVVPALLVMKFLERPYPAIEQDSFEKGTYAVVYIREGLESDCGEEDISDRPSLSVQVIPTDRIAEYCPLVIV